MGQLAYDASKENKAERVQKKGILVAEVLANKQLNVICHKKIHVKKKRRKNKQLHITKKMGMAEHKKMSY